MNSDDKKHRSHLPMPNTARRGLITYDAKDPDTKFPPIEQLRPPKGAPNVLIILIDDAGFGSASAFGGPCQTPNAEKLAANGLKYNRFHTTALCSPTRQALLTGRNHHSAGMGGITEIATGAPGYCSVLPNTMSPLARTLKLNGYSTAQFGKCHEVPVWETSPVGPFDAWPTGGGGFEYFYGFIGGEANQWYPTLYEGHHAGRAEEDARRGLPLHGGHDRQGHGMDLAAEGAGTRQAFLRLLRARRHPCPAPRAQGMGRQVQGQVRPGLGQAARRDLRPAKGSGCHSAGLPAHRAPQGNPGVGRHAGGAETRTAPARWKSMPASWSTPTTMSAACSTACKKLGILDDTLVYYIIGDNGASAEGTLNGTFNEMLNFNGLAALETPEFLTARIDKLGGPESYNHYAVGWAHAMNTPYQWTKQVASHWGGTRNGTIVHWPKGIKAQGRDPLAVPPRHRRRADDPRSGRTARAGLGERRAAAADRGRQHAVLVQRRQGGGAARDAVFRDVRQPRHLPQGLDRGDAAQDALAAHRREDPGLRRRRLGTLRHGQGLEPGQRPVQADAGEAA